MPLPVPPRERTISRTPFSIRRPWFAIGGVQVKTDVSYIIPTRKAKGASATTVTGAAVQGSTSGNDMAENAAIPALYGSWQATDELHFGIGFNVPFGLTTDNGKDFVGRYHGTRSMLRTMTATPMVAWRPIKELAIGGGIQLEYAKAKLEAAVDFGTVDATSLGGALGGTPGSLADDGQSAIKGDDWASWLHGRRTVHADRTDPLRRRLPFGYHAQAEGHR